MLPNCTNSSGAAINDSGEVIGTQITAGSLNQYHVFRFYNNTLTELPITGLENPNQSAAFPMLYPLALNDNGDIVGPYFKGAFLYHNSTQSDLNALAGSTRSFEIFDPLGINNAGVVVGGGVPFTAHSPSYELPISFKTDVQTNLTPTISPFGPSKATAINALGQIVGWTTEQKKHAAFLYDNGTLTDLGSLPSLAPGTNSTHALALNNVGQIVGISIFGDYYNLDNYAWIYSDGKILDLNRLVPSGTSQLGAAVGINDSGQIAVTGQINYYSYLLTPVIKTVASAPTGLSASALSATQISLHWTAAVGAGFYKIFRSATPTGSMTEIAENDGSTGFVDNNLQVGTSYTYAVASVNSHGVGHKSALVTAATQAMAPKTASVLAAHTKTYSSNILTWTAVPLASSYRLYRAGPNGVSVLVTSTPQLSFVDTGLQPNTVYYYSVVAVNAFGSGPASNLVHIRTLTLAPNVAPVLTATTVSKSRIDLHWTAASGATSYQIFRATTAGGFHSYIGTTTALQFSSTGLTASTSYYYIVVAVNAYGSGPKSNEAGAKTSAP